MQKICCLAYFYIPSVYYSDELNQTLNKHLSEHKKK